MELMVTLAVLAVLLSVGLPKLSIYFQSNRMVSNVNAMAGALHIARSEAIKGNIRASVCKSANPGAAAPVCTVGAGGWEDGWIVFTDNGGTVGAYDAGAGDQILRIQDGTEGKGVTVTANNANILNFVSFSSRGVPKLSNGVSQSGVFRICDERGLTNAAGNVIARGMVLSASGRVRTTKDAAKVVSCP